MELWKTENKRYNTAGYFSPKKPSVYTEIVERGVALSSVQIGQTYWRYSLPACIFPPGGVLHPCDFRVKIPSSVSICPGRSGPACEEGAEPVHCSAQSIARRCLHFPRRSEQLWRGSLSVEPVLDRGLALHSGTEAGHKTLNRVRWCLYLCVCKCVCGFLLFFFFFAKASIVPWP